MKPIEKKLDKLVREILLKRFVRHDNTFVCFVCKKVYFAHVGTVGHFRKRGHHAVRWDLLNNHLLCPNCQDESKQSNYDNYYERIDEEYGKGTAEMLVIKSMTRVKFEVWEMEELYEELKKQL
jgi:rubredoxin